MKILGYLSATIVCLLLSTTSSLAAKYQEIDLAKTKELMAKGALLVNPLSPIEFDHEHIPGSVNIPIEQLKGKLPRDKSQPIVFYCLGEKCIYSWRAAEDAAELGYTNLYAFRAGIAAWKGAGNPIASSVKLPEVDVKVVGTEELAKMLAKDDMLLLDINADQDADKFWVDTPKRLHIPLNDLREKYATLPKNKPIVVMCLKGQRGQTAIRYLASKGFSNLAMVDGGIQKWVLEGRPIKKK